MVLGWAGLGGVPWVGGPSPTTPPLSHSAMAVESFTATAPFVQIGRFFLSAGESWAPSDELALPQSPTLPLGHFRGAGAPALSPQKLTGSPCPGHGVSQHLPSIVLLAEARGKVCPLEVGTHENTATWARFP